MDTDLVGACASFVGEDANDWFGASVASAGDVNGDGYDDLLIGAPNNGRGGAYAGSTYLLLGKASGWTLRTKLAGMDASFTGEAAGDASGHSVAGAGDVNGDGYNDIVVGAWGNDDGGSEAGKTYLLFGRATGWSKPMDLSKANASFIGEEAGDKSGYSVSGLGDVNGDGYDDIAIGAHENDEGHGNSAGQTYVILGKPSGWSRDTDLSNASASFIGETYRQYSGFSVAGPGDVNGDGLDDILIGAYMDGEGGPGAGQTYLVLGRTSGWTMDVNLSTSDASFIGEDAGDLSGYAVAGAGDVNGDDLDDILIGAYADEEGGFKAGQTYLVLGRATGWAKDMDLSNASASFLGEDPQDLSGYSVSGAGDVDGDGLDDILIGAYGDEEGGTSAGQTYLIRGKRTGWSMDTNLSRADASFLGEGVGDESGKSIAGGGDFNGDGYDDFLIGAPRDDTGGSDCGITYLIFFDDGALPVIVSDGTPGSATTGDPFTFNLTASDNIGIRNVTVEMWYGAIGYHYNLSASRSSGDQTLGTWLLNVTVSSNSTEPILYRVHVRDRAFNIVSTRTRTVPVLDNDPPSIWGDATASVGTTGDGFQFRTNASDNVHLDEVRVEYWYGDGGNHSIASMLRVSGEAWVHNITVPAGSLEPLRYLFHAEDNASNNVSSETREVRVLDDDPPVVGEDATPKSALIGTELAFRIQLTDNIGVELAWVVYRYGDGQATNVSLLPSSDTYWGVATWVMASTEDLYYQVSAMDMSGNANTTEERSVDVLDVSPPQIMTDASDRLATTGDPFRLNVTVRDDVEIASVTAWYRLGGGTTTSGDMEMFARTPLGDPMFALTLSIPPSLSGTLTYHFHVLDVTGNANASADVAVRILDDDAPVVVEDLTSTSAQLGGVLTFGVVASDNLGIDRVEVGFTVGEGRPDSVEMVLTGVERGLYELDYGVPSDAVGPLRYRFSVADAAGNIIDGDWREVVLLDGIPPEIGDVSWTDPIKGLDIIVAIQASDNLRVDRVDLTYWYHGKPPTTVAMDSGMTASVPIPRDIKDMFRFIVRVSDAAGNEATSDRLELLPTNPPPEVDPIPPWSTVEGAGSIFDLEPFIHDVNDPRASLTLASEDPDVTVEGLVLRARFDVALTDLVLRLIVSDGEDETPFTVSVYIENINDAPVILSLMPANGSRFKEGSRIRFSVEIDDEDGDDLTTTWTSGGRTIGTGTSMSFEDLRPGKRMVRVSVTDGVDTVEGQVTLVIEEGDGSSWSLFIAATVAIVGLGAALAARIVSGRERAH